MALLAHDVVVTSESQSEWRCPEAIHMAVLSPTRTLTPFVGLKQGFPADRSWLVAQCLPTRGHQWVRWGRAVKPPSRRVDRTLARRWWDDDELDPSGRIPGYSERAAPGCRMPTPSGSEKLPIC
jgi:hypothetical protein